MITGGNGSYLYDEDGEEWLDMLGGILNVSLGHKSTPVTQALYAVLQSGLVTSYDRPSHASAMLTELLGEYDKRFRWRLLNTGAEAIERAVQVVAHNIGRLPTIAVLKDSFHGKSISMAGIRYDVPWGNPLDVLTINPESGFLPDFDMLIYEPVSGWDGKVHDEPYLRGICDERGAFLVVDEMITGFLRCGHRFVNTTADMVVSGKGLSQGAPLAVLGISPQLATNLSIGWNTTGGGNNLSASIGLAVLRYLICNEQLLMKRVALIELFLTLNGFGRVYGALGFRDMKGDPATVRAVFEQNHVIASWHGKVLRIGPNFYMGGDEREKFTNVMRLAGEWG